MHPLHGSDPRPSRLAGSSGAIDTPKSTEFAQKRNFSPPSPLLFAYLTERLKMPEMLSDALNSAIREVLNEIGPRMVAAAQARVGQELPEWAALAPGTIAEKHRLGFYGQVSATDPNLRTGSYRDSFVFEVVADWPRYALNLSNTSPVASYIEDGSDTAPPRPTVGPVVAEFREEIIETVKMIVARVAADWTRAQIGRRLPPPR